MSLVLEALLISFTGSLLALLVLIGLGALAYRAWNNSPHTWTAMVWIEADGQDEGVETSWHSERGQAATRPEARRQMLEWVFSRDGHEVGLQHASLERGHWVTSMRDAAPPHRLG